jgi:hypothetical protein
VAGRLCSKLGMSRQNYYKGRKERQRREADRGLADQLVPAQWAVQPRLGGRKLFHILGPELEYCNRARKIGNYCIKNRNSEPKNFHQE